MKRLEIFANRTVRDDLIGRLEKALPDFYYTFIPLAHGVGSSRPRMGTAVWPEENFILIVYDEEERIGRITEIVDHVKAEYPREGVKYFSLP